MSIWGRISSISVLSSAGQAFETMIRIAALMLPFSVLNVIAVASL